MDNATELASAAGAARTLIAVGGGILVARGILTSGQVSVLSTDIMDIAGALASAAPLIWSVYQKISAARAAKAHLVVAVQAGANWQASSSGRGPLVVASPEHAQTIIRTCGAAAGISQKGT